MEPTPKKQTRAYTTTSGERVTKYSDGTEKRVAATNPTAASITTPTVPTGTQTPINIGAGIPATMATSQTAGVTLPQVQQPLEVANEAKSFGQTYLDNLKSEAQARLAQAEAPVTAGEQNIRQLMGLANTESATREKLEKSRGVTDIEEKMRQAEQSIAQQIAAIDDFDDSTAFNTEEMRIDASRRDVTKATFGAQSAEYNLQRALQRRGQAAQLRATVAANAALQGNLELATEQVDKALNSIYDPIKQDLAMEQFFLQRNDKRFDTAQKEVSDLRLKQIDRQFAEIDRATNLVDSAVASGYASGEDIKKMTALSGNPKAQAEYALEVAGLGARERIALENMARNVSMQASAIAQRKNLMELAIAGDIEAIKQLNFDPGAPIRDKAKAELDKTLSSQIDQQKDVINRLTKVSQMTGAIKSSTGFIQSGFLTGMGSQRGEREIPGIGSLPGGIYGGLRGAQNKAQFLSEMNYLLAGEGFKQFSKLKEEGVNLTPVSELEFNKIMQSASMLSSAAEFKDGKIVGFGQLSPEVIQSEIQTMIDGAAKIRDEKAAIKNVGYDAYIELQRLQQGQ